MKIRILALILISAFVCLAQTSNQNNPPAGKTQTETASVSKAGCACCEAMGESKDAKPCCPHDPAAKDAKDAPACCQHKDGISCKRDEKSADAAVASCGGGKDQKGCCAKSDKVEQTAMACCGGANNHCGSRQHEHADIAK